MACFRNAFASSNSERNIYRAIYSGNVDKFNDILDSYEPEYLTSWAEGEELLTVAMECKRVDIAKILLTKGCVIGDAVTLCSQALCCGDVELVKLFLDRDPECLHRRLAGDTLLHLAVRGQLEPMVKLLIDHGANVNLADSKGLFPVHVAARSGHFDILILLLNSGANIEKKSLCDSETSLSYAIKNYSLTPMNSERYKTVVKVLLIAGANVNCIDGLGRTPLHLACFLNHRDLLPFLLNAGADVNINDEEGMVPCDAFAKKMSSSPHVHCYIPFPLVQHLILLKEAGLYLHKRNQSITDAILRSYCHDISVDSNIVSPSSSIVMNIFENCQKEIELMKKAKTVNGSVLFDVLKKLNKKSLYSATESEIKLLKCVISQNKFPMYTVILKPHLKYAELRNGLLAQAQHCLASLIDSSELQIPVLPEEIIIHIISFLENWDLELFINGFLLGGGASLNNIKK